MEGHTLQDLAGTTWTGTKHLWLDPDAPPYVSDATVSIEDEVVRYTWSFEGQAHAGTYQIKRAPGSDEVEATFQDSWHQPRPMVCTGTLGDAPLLVVVGSYAAPPGPDWRWRTVISLRSTGELALQMINVAPWGEEQRAVLLVAHPDR